MSTISSDDDLTLIVAMELARVSLFGSQGAAHLAKDAGNGQTYHQRQTDLAWPESDVNVDWSHDGDHGTAFGRQHYIGIAVDLVEGLSLMGVSLSLRESHPIEDGEGVNTGAQAESYAKTDVANRGPRHAGISDAELCKALRHRAGLPETCATDAYLMMRAEQRIKLPSPSNPGTPKVENSRST